MSVPELSCVGVGGMRVAVGGIKVYAAVGKTCVGLGVGDPTAAVIVTACSLEDPHPEIIMHITTSVMTKRNLRSMFFSLHDLIHPLWKYIGG
jgi:ribose 5-phosphate isomerase